MNDNYYFAGLFDGEGWFSIRRAKASHYGGTREWAFQASTHLAMREKSIIDQLNKEYGGTVRKVPARKAEHSDCWEWRLGGLESLAFAEKMQSILRAKSSQAKVLIAFQNEKIKNGNQPVSDERYSLYEQYYEQMKELNARGVGKV